MAQSFKDAMSYGMQYANVTDPDTGEVYVLVRNHENGHTRRYSPEEFERMKQDTWAMMEMVTSLGNKEPLAFKDPRMKDILEDPDEEFFEELAAKYNESRDKR